MDRAIVHRGKEVAVPDKLQVRLEALAAGELPELEVTTSAFGMAAIGQISQLPFYDAFSRGVSTLPVALLREKRPEWEFQACASSPSSPALCSSFFILSAGLSGPCWA